MAVMGENPSKFEDKNRPVDSVSWTEASLFCRKLSRMTGLIVRLPTECEWEFSCLSGSKTMYSSGNTEKDLAEVAWYSGNSNGMTQPVGGKIPNRFGLFDMHGNVWQWCHDFYCEDYYSYSKKVDPRGPLDGIAHVMRGGSWHSSPKLCRATCREAGSKGRKFIGFRIVCETIVPPQRPVCADPRTGNKGS